MFKVINEHHIHMQEDCNKFEILKAGKLLYSGKYIAGQKPIDLYKRHIGLPLNDFKEYHEVMLFCSLPKEPHKFRAIMAHWATLELGPVDGTHYGYWLKYASANSVRPQCVGWHNRPTILVGHKFINLPKELNAQIRSMLGNSPPFAQVKEHLTQRGIEWEYI